METTSNSCCFTKVGAFVAGYISLAFYVILCIIFTIYIIFDINAVNGESEEEKTVGVIGLILHGISIFYTLISITFTIVLLVGLQKIKPGHLSSYLIWTKVTLIIGVMGFIRLMFFGFITLESAAFNIVQLAFMTYFHIVINNRLNYMRKEIPPQVLYTYEVVRGSTGP